LETSKAKQDLLFVNKKKQKNFDYLKHLTLTMANPAGTRRFLLLFFKKEALSCGSRQSLSMIVPEEIIPERAISLFYVKPDNSIKNNLARAVKILGNPKILTISLPQTGRST
jgi:hypothetical protein